MLEDALEAALDEAATCFCQTAPSTKLVEALKCLDESHHVVLVYDLQSRAYAEAAQWALLAAGYSTSLLDSHTAQYYSVPYSSTHSFYIYFCDDPNSQTAVQLASALRIMEHRTLALSPCGDDNEDVIGIGLKSDILLPVRALKIFSYGFTDVIYAKSKNQRFARVLDNLAIEERQLKDYIARALSFSQPVAATLIGAQSALLTAARVTNIVNHEVTVDSIDSLFTRRVGEPVEVWGFDIDSELIARARFNSVSNHVLRAVHFGIDPLSFSLISVYAYAFAKARKKITDRPGPTGLANATGSKMPRIK